MENAYGDGRIACCMRVARDGQRARASMDCEQFSLPKYIARYGWLIYYLDLPRKPIDWAAVENLLRISYRLQAPRSLVRLLDGL